MTEPLFLCCDLDRTVLPNGEEPEAPGSREAFAALLRDPDVTLAYVTGRSLAKSRSAMQEWSLPHPHFLVADVGASIYRPSGEAWELVDEWHARIGGDWEGINRAAIERRLAGIEELVAQPPEDQQPYKCSFFTPLNCDPRDLEESIRGALAPTGIAYRVITSVDTAEGVGLVDVLPESASKLRAIRFLQQRLELGDDRTIFAGDSGNDLDVLVSTIPAILVANASDSVRTEATERSADSGCSELLYLAEGGFEGRNGNYLAGVLEGIDWYRRRRKS